MTQTATKQANRQLMISDGRKGTRTSSKTNKKPAIGAPKAAANPAAPPVAKNRRAWASAWLFQIRPTATPRLAPIMIQGPSRPSDKPPAKEVSAPKNLVTSTRHHFICKSPWIMISTWGMPLPPIKRSQRRKKNRQQRKNKSCPKNDNRHAHPLIQRVTH